MISFYQNHILRNNKNYLIYLNNCRYFSGFLFFGNHFLSNTGIDCISYSHMKKEKRNPSQKKILILILFFILLLIIIIIIVCYFSDYFIQFFNPAKILLPLKSFFNYSLVPYLKIIIEFNKIKIYFFFFEKCGEGVFKVFYYFNPKSPLPPPPLNFRLIHTLRNFNIF